VLGLSGTLVCIATGGVYPQKESRRKAFLHRLPEAAIERTHHSVRYDPAYVRIPYPGGDVPSDTGVCANEVIRSYHALGIDLQKEVQEGMQSNFWRYPNHARWMLLHIDTNISTIGETRTWWCFFKRQGEQLPISKNAADYNVGELVTRDLRGGPHIGIVVDMKSASGHYKIVHNIAQGPRVEVVLFKWRITGRYRYFGPRTS